MYVPTYPPANPGELRELIKQFSRKDRFLQQINRRFKSSPADRKLIITAFHWNAELFTGIYRLNGESYMEGHLTPVAVLLLQHWDILNAVMIAAALTHDSPEDFPDIVTHDLVAEKLSDGVSYIVAGATKPPLKGRDKKSAAYSHATMSRVEAHGPDCVFLKCEGDRLHNMLTLWGTPVKKRWKIWQTEQYYLPLARRFKFPTQELQLAIAEQKKRLHIDDTF